MERLIKDILLTLYVIGGGAGHGQLSLTWYVNWRGGWSSSGHVQLTLTLFVIGRGSGHGKRNLTLFFIGGGDLVWHWWMQWSWIPTLTVCVIGAGQGQLTRNLFVIGGGACQGQLTITLYAIGI